MQRLKLYLPLFVVLLTALLVLADFFTTGVADGIGHALALWVSIIAGVLLLLGLGNIARVHLGRLQKGEAGWVYSLALLVSAIVVIVAGVVGRVAGYQDGVSNWIFQYIYQPLATTLFSLLAFLLISAALRTLRIRSIESALLVIGALVVLLGQVAFAPFSSLSSISQWFQDYPVLGIIRGILIGTALGAIATSLRYLLGVDNNYMR
jgi:ABC-type antimicrobial peptide transport system permease subunit